MCNHLPTKVTEEVRGRVAAGKVPSTQEQLDNYIKQVVEQIQKLTKGAPTLFG